MDWMNYFSKKPKLQVPDDDMTYQPDQVESASPTDNADQGFVDPADQVKDYLMKKYAEKFSSVHPDKTTDTGKAISTFGSILENDSDPTKKLAQIEKGDEERRQSAFAPLNEEMAREHDFSVDDAMRTKQAREGSEYKDDNDPTSQKSIFAQNLLKKMNPKVNVSKMSYADIAKQLPMVEKIYDADQRSKDRNAQITAAKINKEAALGEKTKKTNMALKEKISNKISASGRGVAGDLRQAVLDNYNTQKIKEIIRPYVKDVENPTPEELDKLPLEMIGMQVSEASKVARGGVPTVLEHHTLMPDKNINAALAKLRSKATSQPTAANIGAYVKLYYTYARDIQDNARKTLNKNADAQINLWDRELPEEDKQDLRDFTNELYTEKVLNGDTENPPGTTIMTDSKGKVYHIPNDKVEEAKKDGLK